MSKPAQSNIDVTGVSDALSTPRSVRVKRFQIKLALLVAIVSAALLFFGTGLGYLVAYQPNSFPFDVKDLSSVVNRQLTRFDVPRTVSQINYLYSDAISNLGSFKNRAYMSLRVPSVFDASIRVDGRVNLTDFQLNQTGTVFFQPYEEEFASSGVEISGNDGAMFLKLNDFDFESVSSYVGKPDILDKWYSVEAFASNTGSSLVGLLGQVLQSDEFMQDVELVGSDTIDGREVYRLKYAASKVDFIKLKTKIIEVWRNSVTYQAEYEQLLTLYFDSIDIVGLDMWVYQSSYLPYRVVLNVSGVVPNEFIDYKWSSETIELSSVNGKKYDLEFGLELSAINQPQEYTEVLDAKAIDLLVVELSDSLVEKYAESVIEQVNEFVEKNEGYPTDSEVQDLVFVQPVSGFGEEIQSRYFYSETSPKMLFWVGTEISLSSILLLHEFDIAVTSEIDTIALESLLSLAEQEASEDLSAESEESSN